MFHYFNLSNMLYMNLKIKQECIPVGCVPPACWPYPSMHWAGGVYPSMHWAWEVCVSQHALGMGSVCIPACTGQGGVSQHALGRGKGVCPEGVCPGVGGCLPRRGVSGHGGVCPGGCLPGGVCPGWGVCPGGCGRHPQTRGRHPPVDRQTPVKT